MEYACVGWGQQQHHSPFSSFWSSHSFCRAVSPPRADGIDPEARRPQHATKGGLAHDRWITYATCNAFILIALNPSKNVDGKNGAIRTRRHGQYRPIAPHSNVAKTNNTKVPIARYCAPLRDKTVETQQYGRWVRLRRETRSNGTLNLGWADTQNGSSSHSRVLSQHNGVFMHLFRSCCESGHLHFQGHRLIISRS